MTRTYRPYVVAAGVAAIVTASNASEGGYFSQSWGWIALAFLVPTTVLLIVDGGTASGRLRIAFAALMGSFAIWIALSSLWSVSSSASVREVERVLVYLAVALAVAFVLRRSDTTGVLAGVVVGVTIVCAYAFAVRLYPDQLGAYDDPTGPGRLAVPLGYTNALALLAALGVVLSLGFCSYARAGSWRAAPALAVPMLVAVMYFTFSRGGWGALVVGITIAVALSRERFRLLLTTLACVPGAALAIAVASRQPALDEFIMAADVDATPIAVATATGCLLTAALVTAVGAYVDRRRWSISSRTTRLGAISLLLAATAAVVIGAALGATDEVRSKLTTPAESAPLNERILSLTGNGRGEQYRVAWDAARERPLIGHGAGTYEYLWYAHRPATDTLRDAHSLFLEAAAEVGLVGLVLLVSALVLPMVACARSPRSGLIPAAAGAYLAWFVASGLDWHWEVVGVTMTGLIVGSVLFLAPERSEPDALGGRTRLALIGVTAALSVFGVVSLVGNQALFAGHDALAREDWSGAGRDARRARALLPWSYEPAIVLGDAAAGAGDREGALRAYRAAVAEDPRNWVTWLHLAQVATSEERVAAYDRVRELNPLETGLPGE